MLIEIEKEDIEIFLRGIVTLADKAASYRWWDMIRHRHPAYQWNGEKLVSKRDVSGEVEGPNSVQRRH